MHRYVLFAAASGAVVVGACGSGFEGAAASATSTSTAATGGAGTTATTDTVASTGGADVGVATATASTSVGGTSPVGTSTTGTSTGCPTCGAGEFCQVSTSQCKSCDTFESPIDFAQPIPLSNIVIGSVAFPRETKDAGRLYYDHVTMGHVEIFQTVTGGAPTGWSDGTPIGVASSTDQLSAPLPLPMASNYNPLGLSTGSLLLTDSASGMASVVATDPLGVGALSTLADFDDDGEKNIDPAVAYGLSPARLWWTRDGNFVTRVAGAPTPPVGVTLKDENNCAITPLGSPHPWVHPHGTFLVYSGFYGASCGQEMERTHLFLVALDNDGQPMGPVQRLFPNDDDLKDSPSFSGDYCGLYFSADSQGVNLFYAPRQ